MEQFDQSDDTLVEEEQPQTVESDRSNDSLAAEHQPQAVQRGQSGDTLVAEEQPETDESGRSNDLLAAEHQPQAVQRGESDNSLVPSQPQDAQSVTTDSLLVNNAIGSNERVQQAAEVSQVTSELNDTAQNSDPFEEVEPQTLQIKTENATANLDGSTIILSDDSFDNSTATEFDDLRNVLAYDSDDDIDEAIQKEFDYLVSIGKLPAPIMIKEEEDTVSTSQEIPVLVRPNVNGIENGSSASADSNASNSQMSTLSNDGHEDGSGENANDESTASNVAVSVDVVSTSSGPIAGNEHGAVPNAADVPKAVVPKKEPAHSSSGNSSSNSNGSNEFDVVAGHFELVRKVSEQVQFIYSTYDFFISFVFTTFSERWILFPILQFAYYVHRLWAVGVL